MIKRNVILIAVFLSLVVYNGLAQALSERAKISLITIGPGKELYSSFGHSAFWVYDPVGPIDRVYNYGTFDFSDPDFYSKFVRGKLLYRLSVSDMERVFAGAQYDDRGIIEQTLNLNKDQKEKLFEFLEKNYLPENRYYKYDFFFDNCSSRLRDALKSVCGEDLVFNLTTDEDKSFRQMLDPYLINKQWQDMGMDVGLGTPSDQIAKPYDYMFLPDFLKDGFASATLNTSSGKVPLVSSTSTLYEGGKAKEGSVVIGPHLFFWILLMVAILYTLYQLKRDHISLSIDVGLLIFTGLLGFLLLFLWFGTDHYVTRNNWNLVWAMPLNIVAAFLLVSKKRKGIAAKYLFLYSIVIFALLLVWPVLPQELNLATLPFIMIMGLRSFFIYYRYKIAQ